MRMYKTLISSVAVSALLFLAPNAMAEDEIGINSAVKGDVMVQSGEQAAKQAIVKDPLLLGDEVNTTADSSLQVLLKDQTVFTVGPDCQLTIDKFVYDPNKNNNSLSATVSKGMFRFMSGNISKSGPDAVSIDTPVASMGVRGTMVEGLVGADAIAYAIKAGLISPDTKVDAEGATLFVLRGPGRRSKARNQRGEISVTSGGRTVKFRRSGFAVFVGSADTPPTEPMELDGEIFNIFNTTLRTEPTGGASFKPFELEAFIETEPTDIQPSPSGSSSGSDSSGGSSSPDTPGDPSDPTDPDGGGGDDGGGAEDDPSTLFDLPIDDDIVVADCTPQNPDYPDCLL